MGAIEKLIQELDEAKNQKAALEKKIDELEMQINISEQVSSNIVRW